MYVHDGSAVGSGGFKLEARSKSKKRRQIDGETSDPLSYDACRFFLPGETLTASVLRCAVTSTLEQKPETDQHRSTMTVNLCAAPFDGQTNV